MNYIAIFVILGLAVVLSTGSVDAAVEVRMDQEKTKLETETATFGLG